MNYEESAKIVELESEIKQLKADITHLQRENKEIRQILSTFINQNAVELSQIHAQKDKNNATLTQHGLSAGFTRQTPNGASELAKLRFNAIHTQQNSFSHRQNDGGHSTLLARAIADISAEQENGQSHSSDRERNRAESRSETRIANEQEISRRGGAQSRESGAISRRGGAETERSERISAISVCKTRLNDRELSTLKGYDEENQEKIIEKINNTISKIDKDIQYYEKKKSVFTSEAKERIPKQIMSDILGLQTELNKYSTNANIIKNTTNSKAFENVNKFYQTQKTQHQRQR